MRGHTRSIVLTWGVTHRLALGGVVGTSYIALPAAAVKATRVVLTQLLTTTVSEVPTLIHIQATPQVLAQFPSCTAATVEKPLGAYSTHVVTAASPKVARRHIDTAGIVRVQQ